MPNPPPFRFGNPEWSSSRSSSWSSSRSLSDESVGTHATSVTPRDTPGRLLTASTLSENFLEQPQVQQPQVQQVQQPQNNDPNYERSLTMTEPNQIVGKEMDKLPTYYTFIVKNDKIINIFESINPIKLDSTYSYNEKNYLPNNYITSSDEKDFHSIFVQTNTDITENFQNTPYIGFNNYSSLNTDKKIIKFYVYKHDDLTNQTMYYTYGEIYVYGYGIMSTREIISTNDENVFIKIPINVFDPIPDKLEPISGISENHGSTAIKTNYPKLIAKIQEQIFSSDTVNTVNKTSVYIHYLNAILPKDIKIIFNDSEIIAVIKILYVQLKYNKERKTDKETETDEKTKKDKRILLNEFNTYINYYYDYKESVGVKTSRKIDEYNKVLQNENQRFYSDFSMHIFDFFEFLMFLKYKDTELKYINLCINIYEYYFYAHTKGFETLEFATLELQKETIKKIKNTISVKGVHTFLQIISPEYSQYNEKFKIRLNKEESDVLNKPPDPNSNKSMLIEYTASTKSFYNKNNNNNKITNESNDTNTYTETYKFGPFNKIYKPITITDPDGFTNYSEITTSSSEFTKVLKLQGPLMFSFHGPSGSGKSEIFKPIFLGVCKNFGSTHPTLNIKFKEIFKKYDVDENAVVEVDTVVFQFTFTNGAYKMVEQKTHIPYHKTHIQTLNKLNTGQGQPVSKTFNANDTLETVLTYFLEQDRLIKGITTNYNSSRSHVLCFLEFEKSSGEKRYIIFDDLAENEKTYECNNIDIGNFKNIKRIIGKDIFPFYENEFDSTGENFDSQNGGTNQQNMIAWKESTAPEQKALYNKLIKNACEHRGVEGKFINDSLKDFRKDLEYIVNVKNRDIEYYIPDIYYDLTASFIPSCLQDFCFGKMNCFSLPKENEPFAEPKSIILKNVYEYLKGKQVITDSTTFYDKLELCIFGVLNISRAKNDPVPIQYIDINSVKSIVRNKDKFTFPFVKDLFLTKLKESISRCTKLSATQTEDMLNDIKNKFNVNNINEYKKVFDTIDDENAKTAIGTLEFMNKISKFNTVNSICYEKNVGKSHITYKKELYPSK